MVTGHFGIKTLWDTSAPISRHFDTSAVIDTSTQDNNSDETQLHRWFGLNFGTNFVVPNCLGTEVSCGRSVRLTVKHACTRDIAVCNSVFRPTTSCFFPEIFARDPVAKLSEIGPKFWCFWTAIFFGGGGPKFLTIFYKFGSPSNVLKSGDDRPIDLGDWVENERREISEAFQNGQRPSVDARS